jgi:cell division protein FtsW
LHLPAAENDFIFAVLGQEFGLVGGAVVIGLFVLLAWRGILIAMRAPDTFGGLLALGITSWLVFQAFINIAVVVNLIPLTGMPLPFLSDGGTSLVVVLAAVGILLSISRESVTRGVSAHEDPHRGRGHGRPHLPRLGRRDPSADPAA